MEFLTKPPHLVLHKLNRLRNMQVVHDWLDVLARKCTYELVFELVGKGFPVCLETMNYNNHGIP